MSDAYARLGISMHGVMINVVVVLCVASFISTCPTISERLAVRPRRLWVERTQITGRVAGR